MPRHVRTDHTRCAGRAGAEAVSRMPATAMAPEHDPVLARFEEPS
jgi:hypothetical protein